MIGLCRPYGALVFFGCVLQRGRAYGAAEMRPALPSCSAPPVGS
jgi:hypothetical protein